MTPPVYAVNTFTTESTIAARENGFSFVCSMCVRLHEGHKMAKGNWDRTRCTGSHCVGPLGGGCYPEYAGPLSEILMRFCFMCGDENPRHGISPNTFSRNTQIIGCCDEHLGLVMDGSFDVRPTGTRRKQKVRIAGHEIEL